MSIHYESHGVTLHHGDCLAVLRTLPDAARAIAEQVAEQLDIFGEATA